MHDAQGQFNGHFDATRMEQAFCNLVDNAAKHGAVDLVVTITLRNQAAYALLSIHNDGLPIHGDDLPRIFDPMTGHAKFAADEEGPNSGLGLGLYIAHQIVTAQQGKIEVVPDARKGTIFRIKRPLAPN